LVCDLGPVEAHTLLLVAQLQPVISRPVTAQDMVASDQVMVVTAKVMVATDPVYVFILDAW
jgi:hypothetical protein